MTLTRSRIYLLLILAAAFLVRLAAAFYLGNNISGLSGAQDEVSYSMLGHRFATGHGLTFPTAWYPWIAADTPQSYYSATMSLSLAAVYALVGYQPLVARLIMAALGTLVVALIMALAWQFFGRTVALVSGAIAALYAYLIFYGVTLVTETPFMLSILAAIYVSLRIVKSPSLAKWMVLGLTLAIAVLFRMAVVFYVAPLLVWIWARLESRRYMVLLPVVVIGLSVLPFTIHNYLLWGRFLLLEAQFGHVFWNGNHPGHHGDFNPVTVFPIPAEILASHNDVEITSRLLFLGVQNVLRDPGGFLLLTLTRLREFFLFWPTAKSGQVESLLRVLSFGMLWPFAVLGLLRSRGRWRELAPLLLYMLALTAVYSVTWTMIRYRVPVDAVLIPFGALGVVSSWTWLYGALRRQAGVVRHGLGTTAGARAKAG
jgi:4-amino-4-deoxy-L-arabinose transferase-like glycosyltransferase